ncbi:hypothetical protein ACR777_15125 [Sphingobacterium spiritivorum]|uniref:hypothetical protein n=1 Tax=Sphingobacterium spiritivorum TaxID=258 RepID=UPI003DA2705C
MEEIKKWLENPDYKKGVELYCRLGNSEFLKELFKSGEDEYTFKKLREAISSLAIKNDQPDQIKPYVDNTFLLSKLRKERDQTYRQIDSNMFALRNARNDQSRCNHAFQILRLQRKKQELLDNLQYLEIHGSLPSDPPKKEFVTNEIQRLYVQIWKTKKRLERTDLRNRSKTEELLINKKLLLKKLQEERGLI